MAWIIKWDGKELNSDDFLISDLQEIEKATGEPWSTANCYRSVKVARAFLAVALLRLGKSEMEVADALGTVTLKTLKNTFDFVPDEDDEPSPEGSVPLAPRDRLAKTSRGSSHTGRVKGGHRPKPADNESEMSSAS